MKSIVIAALSCLALNAFAGDPVSLTTPTIATAMTSGTTYGPYTYTLSNNVGAPVNLSPSNPISVTGDNTEIASITNNCPSNGQGVYVPVGGCTFDLSFTPSAAGTIDDSVVVDFTGGSMQPSITSVIPTISVAAATTFLAVGYTGTLTGGTPYVFESTDAGATWSVQSISGIPNVGLTAAGGGNGTLVFGGMPTFSLQQTQYVNNGSGWSLVSSTPSSTAIKDFAYGNNYFIAATSGTVWYSTNGSSWTGTSINTTSSASIAPSAAIGNGYYTTLFCPNNGSVYPQLYYSTNLSTWSNASIGNQNVQFRDITYGNNVWVAVGGNQNAGDVVSVYTASAPNAAWSSLTGGQLTAFSGSTALKTIAYGNSQFVAIGSTGIVYTSSNGTTWTAGNTLPSFFPAVHGLTYSTAAGSFVAVGTNSKIFTSTDGNSWTASTGISPSNITFTGVSASN